MSEVKWSEVAESCLTLCDPIDCSLPVSSVHEISQVIVLEWIAISFSKGSSQPRARTQVSWSNDSEILNNNNTIPLLSLLPRAMHSVEKFMFQFWKQNNKNCENASTFPKRHSYSVASPRVMSCMHLHCLCSLPPRPAVTTQEQDNIKGRNPHLDSFINVTGCTNNCCITNCSKT